MLPGGGRFNRAECAGLPVSSLRINDTFGQQFDTADVAVVHLMVYILVAIAIMY